MKAGELRHVVTIEEHTAPEQDASGGLTETWGTLSGGADVPANVQPIAGARREQQTAQRLAAGVDHIVEMRWFAGVIPKQRLKFGIRLLDILEVVNVGERDKEMILACKERVD